MMRPIWPSRTVGEKGRCGLAVNVAGLCGQSGVDFFEVSPVRQR